MDLDSRLETIRAYCTHAQNAADLVEIGRHDLLKAIDELEGILKILKSALNELGTASSEQTQCEVVCNHEHRLSVPGAEYCGECGKLLYRD